MISFTNLKVRAIQKLIAERGIEEKGKVQKYIDSEVLRLSDPYVPFRTGGLKGSGIRATTLGSGKVKYNAPYARKQYYENKGTGLRGKLWFERMKADRKNEILKGAADIAGGKAGG